MACSSSRRWVVMVGLVCLVVTEVLLSVVLVEIVDIFDS